MRRAWSRSILARPYICRLMSLSLVIWPPGLAVRPHGEMMAFADSVEKVAARVLHQLPSICHLVGMRHRFGDCLSISTTSISGDNRDRRMSPGPSPRGVLFPIWKQCPGPAPLEVADNCPVSLAASECKVVDTDDGEFVTRLLSPPAHDTQQGVVAHRHRRRSAKAAAGLPPNASPK